MKTVFECDKVVFDVDWSPDGRYLAIVGASRELVLLKIDDEDPFNVTEVFREQRPNIIRRVHWSPDGKRLVTAGFDGVAVLYEFDEDKQPVLEMIGNLYENDKELKSARWSHSGKYIVTCNRDKSIFVWDVEELEYIVIHTEHKGDVKDVMFSPDDSKLVSVSFDGTVKVWSSMEEYGSLQTFTHHTYTVWELAFDNENDEFVTIGEDGKAVHYIEEDGKYIDAGEIQLNRPLDCLYAVTYRNGEWLISGVDHKIYIMNDTFEEKIGEFDTGQLGDINCIKPNPEKQNIIAVASDDGTVLLIDHELSSIY
ncbi:WD repeat protein, putative [Trichomonas vaginalis G3]|uniref:WD repeat protein, putative n=1 Tax=Trichomonas vaginalis (strain ATCC PRA-98 / G3) TaxID=412133 RepID=A2FL76_TRIV3|nr:iron-sulfur cluster assembly [Trichomonas vaginalis G3]EAX94332.1 WD repeat protein, putative [Trichomonas vaginalis G3]KAI5521815.1 iron-sulfur cluster assembly [Trichomonas vaginalis G3]|eukprot:XP_001307262.1 WD repeat protein [Trichomonas vaginalis G3]